MKKTNQKSKKRKRPKKDSAAGSNGKRQNKKVTGKEPNKQAVAQTGNKRILPKKTQEKKIEKQGKGIGGYLNKAAQFLRESRTELKKVKWPNRKELLASTAVVILLVLIVAFFLGIVDFALIKIIKHVVG